MIAKVRWTLAGWAAGLAFAAAALLQAAEPQAESDAQIRAKLSGLWKGFTVEGKGETPDRGPVQIELTVTPKVIRGIQIQNNERIDHGEGEYTLDLSASPPRLDATKTAGRGRKQAYVGIFKLEGDTFRWCVSPQKVRPETFETKKGQFLLILKRDKPAQ